MEFICDTETKRKAIELYAGYTDDELPVIAEDIDTTGLGFRAIPPLLNKFSAKPIMQHIEAGYIMAKMWVAPQRSYDTYIDRLLRVKRAECESGKSRFISVEDFSVSAMVRLYAMFRGRINVSEERWGLLKQSLLQTQFAPYFEPMSENHKLCFLSSELIAAQLFPDDVFYDGLDGKTRLPLVKADIKKYLNIRLKRGWREYDSISYYEIDFMSLINLYDLAEDKELAELASKLMNIMAASLFIHSAGGWTGGPKGRVYPNALEEQSKGVYSVIKLASEPGEVVAGSFAVTAMIYMATSGFMFDSEVSAIINGKTAKSYEVKDSVGLYTIPDDTSVMGRTYKYFYKDSGYCMGCVIGRDDPWENAAYTWLCGHQEQQWSVAFAENPRAVVYSSHPGNPGMSDFGMHGVWAGDCNCLCQSFSQHKNILLCHWHIKNDAQLQYIHIYFPAEEFDRVSYKNRSVIAAIGNTAIRICTDTDYEKTDEGEYKGRELVINSARGCFAVEIFSGEEAFDTAAAREDFPHITEDGAAYRELAVKNGTAYICGKPFNKKEYKLYCSPYLESEFDSGEVRLKYNGAERIYRAAD